MPLTGTAGSPIPLAAQFYDETSGILTDPAGVTLDITYGTEVGLIADTAGPFSYDGASSPAPGQVYRTGVGSFSFIWQIPGTAPSGVYVANWSFTYAGHTFLGIENFTVTGGDLPASGSAVDLGYWTASISYTPSSFTPAQPASISFGAVDSDGIGWLWQKLEGWDGPDVTGGLLQRAGDHGAWPSPQYYQPRTMTLTVMASAPTQALRDLARAKLSAAIPVSDLAVLTYGEPVPTQALVRRSGKITETYPTLADVVFSIGLVAPDPRKYSAVTKKVTAQFAEPGTGISFPLTFPLTWPAAPPPGSLVLTNDGSFETRPVFTVQGPVEGPSLVNAMTGQAVSWSLLTLSASDVLTVDFGIQQAYLNGAYRPADPSSWWWALAPGTTTIELQATGANNAYVTAVFNDSWI